MSDEVKPVAWLRTSGTGSPVLTDDFLRSFPMHRHAFEAPLYTAEQLNAAVLAERERAEQDAKRYRWLREYAYIELHCDSPRVEGWAPEHLDTKIDITIRKGEE